MSLQGTIAGDAPWAQFKLSVLLFEGTITPTTIEDTYGLERPAVTRAAKLAEGDLVELYDDVAFVYSSIPDGLPVVRKLSSTGASYVGRILSIEKAERMPTTEVSTVSAMISGKHLRVATVEMLGMSGMALIEATIPANSGGAHSIAVGAPTALAYDVSDGVFKYGTGTNNQLIPLTRLTGSTSVDVTGPILCGIGLKTIEKVA